ncbi:MAG: hypothetical protein AAFY41_08490 [Bacteroidota bacterium]
MTKDQNTTDENNYIENNVFARLLDFTAQDLDANRNGKVSVRQLSKFKKDGSQLGALAFLMVLPLAFGLLFFAETDQTDVQNTMLWFLVIISTLLLVAGLTASGKPMRTQDFPVRAVTGVCTEIAVRKLRHGTSYVKIDNQEYSLAMNVPDFFEVGKSYTLYLVEENRVISIEPEFEPNPADLEKLSGKGHLDLSLIVGVPKEPLLERKDMEPEPKRKRKRKPKPKR